MDYRRLAVCLVIGVPWAMVAAQPGPATTGDHLKVPPPHKHLFFAVQPVTVEGSVFVPLTAVERWLSARIRGDRRREFAIVYYGETPHAINLRLWVGQPRAMVAQAEVPLDHPPQVIGDETFVPLGFVAEAIGVWVEPYGHTVRLRKPDEDWVCHLAIPPHPLSLEGKMVALAVARRPEVPKRVEVVALSPDTMSGYVSLAEPADDEAGVRRYTARYARDRTGWHFTVEGPPADPPAPPEED